MTESHDPSAPLQPGSLSLPASPNLEHLKTQAKRHLGALRNADPAAKLADAQFAVARAYGFASWRELKTHVDASPTQPTGPTQRVQDAAVDAAKRGDVASLSELLDRFPSLMGVTAKPFGMPLLHQAAYDGQAGVVELLLQRGADANERSEGDNAYPVHFAAEMGHLEIVRRLVAAGNDIHWAQTEHELDALGWATCFGEVQHDVAAYLMQQGAQLGIFSAVALGRVDDVQRLIAADALLLEKPMSRYEQHRRPLHLAVQKNQPGVVRALLDLGADVNAQDKLGMTPLAMAGADTDPAIIAALKAGGSSVGLLEALVTGDFETRAAALLKDDPDRIKPGGQDEAAIVLAAQRKAIDAVRWLLEHGADVDTTGAVYDIQTTALHQAAAANDLPMIQLLLDAGADTALKDNVHGGTPHGWAHHFGKAEAMALLESHDSNR